MDEKIIGIVGGFGSYATLHFFKQILDAFPAEKEWDRPRILIDNYCTLPSRVRCILYDEKKPEIIAGLSSSIKNLINMGSTHIIITCNTAHYFLDEVYINVPESKSKVIHIIEETAIKLSEKNINEVSLLASEGTIIAKIYDKIFEKYDIKINSPNEKDFNKIRELIETVKQNKKLDENIKNKFVKLVLEQKSKNIILGCTELPIIYDEFKESDEIININFYNPLTIAIDNIRGEL